MYVDDICLMAPSPAALQELIDICYDFSVQNDLSFNSSKSYCMVFKPKSYKLSCLRLYMDNHLLKYTDDIEYLGCKRFTSTIEIVIHKIKQTITIILSLFY